MSKTRAILGHFMRRAHFRDFKNIVSLITGDPDEFEEIQILSGYTWALRLASALGFGTLKTLKKLTRWVVLITQLLI